MRHRSVTANLVLGLVFVLLLALVLAACGAPADGGRTDGGGATDDGTATAQDDAATTTEGTNVSVVAGPEEDHDDAGGSTPPGTSDDTAPPATTVPPDGGTVVTAPPPSSDIGGDEGADHPLPIEIAEAIRSDAADRAGVDLAEVDIVTATFQTFSDTSLGCPRKGEMYAQVLTDGWVVEVVAGSQRYDYRASVEGIVRFCAQL